MAAPSSSRLPIPSTNQCKFDVFLSFRGSDTRKNFTDHLYTALHQKGILAFKDDEELQRGRAISPELFKAIEESRIAVVIFSRNYASSTWCLDELAKIVDCANSSGLVVLPIFYDLRPTDVRQQTGNFEAAFAGHELSKDNREKVKTWRQALTQVANLSGWDLKDRHETKVIEEIVEHISSHLNFTFPTCHSKNIVGMHRVREIESDLGVGKLDELRVIGICGMPGIGKTTIAQVVFENIHQKFEASSFIANVGEDYEKKGLFHLQKQLFDDLLKTKVTTAILNNVRQRLRNKRVLIILDDVKELEHIVDLVGEGSSEEFGAGSRIIITTRDEKLLENYGSKIHKVEKLTESESLLLFCQKAFKKDHPVDDFLELSYSFTDYANGLPLALVVLGSYLYRRNAKDWSVEKKRWSDELKKLRDSNFSGPEKIFNILKLCFFGLDMAAKEIFLDIACFFKGENETDVRRIFESCGFYPECCIPSLLEKSLITIVGGKLWMHELLQQTGQQIVREESKWLGERSRLWDHTDIVPVLQNNKGTELVKGIFLSSPQQARVHLKADPFSEMRNLRLLKIKNVILSGCLEFTLSDLLSFFEWHGYPLKFLPSSFRPDKLVELHLPQSQIERLWEENIKQPLEMLVIVDLSDCEFLTKTLDFSQVPKLERLILKGCKRLSDIHPSIGDLKGLISLNLQGCESLTTLPPSIKLGSLMTFILSGCSKLKRFPEIGENMKNLLELHLDGTAIVELPTSIKHLTSLSLLNLKDCKLLQSLPDVICTSTSLQTLILQGCSNLCQLPENLGSLECLKVLDISRSAIRQVPPSIQFLKNLTGLSCAGCRDLPAERSSWCLPTFISCFLPPDLASNNSSGLQLPASFSGLCSLRKLILSDCNLLEGSIPDDIGCISSLQYLDLSGNNFETLPQSISQLYQLEDLHLNDCRNLKSLPTSLPISIRGIFSDNCPLLDETFQEIVWTSTALGFSFINCKYNKFYPLPTADQHLNQQNIRRFLMELFSQGGCFQFFFGAETDIASWFCRQSTNSSIKIPLPQDLDGKSQWIGFALWFLIESEVHDSVDSEEDPQSEYFNKRNYSCDIFTNDEDPPLKYPLADRDGRETYQHLLYIPADHFVKRLNKCFIEAKINIKRTGVEVVACRARLLYSADVPEFVGTLVHLWNHEQVGHLANPSSSKCTDQSKVYPFASETSFLIEFERQIFRNLSSTRMEGHEVRTRVEALLLEEIFELESARSYDYGFIFSLRAILPWFTHQSIGSVVLSLNDQSIGGVVGMYLPPLLHSDNEWVGFSLFVAFTLPPPGVLAVKYSSVNCRLLTSRGIMGPQHNLTLEFPGEDNFMGSERVLVIHIPRKHFPEDLGDRIQASFESLTPGVEVQMSGIRLVYRQDLNGLIQTITHCTIRSPFAYFGQDDKTFILEENKIGVHLTMEKSLLQQAKDRMLQDWQNSSTGSKVITDQQIELMILSETPVNPPKKKHSVIKWKRNLDLLLQFFFRLPVELSVTVCLSRNIISCSKRYSGIFYQKEIPEWFTEQQSSETLVSPVPTNLRKDKSFLGFVVCAVFSVEPSRADVLKYLYSGHHPRLACNFHLSPEIPCSLEVGSLPGTSPKNKFMWLYLRRFVWLQYIPGHYFKDHLNELPELGVSFTSDSPALAVKQCGFRILYDQEVQKYWKATVQCFTSFFDDNEDHIRQFIEDERHSFSITRSFGVLDNRTLIALLKTISEATCLNK
ncbi:TMV resistance protein N [Rosa chinensis]|uniref:TMV resistance protein N n=1 Tax=Rosa chinensis TaxID=74649 RepID=UPI000D08E616|nr:TMV resistance protein N [Rosa chinensis]